MEESRLRHPEDQQKLEAFKERMQLPIVVSALLPIILSMAGKDSIVADVVFIITWFVFILDFVVRMYYIRRYVRTGQGLFDLVVVVLTAPWFLIPGFGAARFLALARLARLARVMKGLGSGFARLAKQLGRVGLVTLGILLTCAYVAYGAEKATNPEFFDFGQSLWWAIVTITTVGYGDITPITTNGRIAGVILMLSGVAVLGVLAGTLASFFGFGGDTSSDANGSGGTTALPTGATAFTTPTMPEAIVAASAELESVSESAEAELAELRARLEELDNALAAVRTRLG
jgi:voltage-gated potassium channel